MIGNPGLNNLAEFLLVLMMIMEAEFTHIEKELALEAWILYAFKIYDMLLEEDLEYGGWLKADLMWFNRN